ncbi:MAG: carboxypeptidase-like regulatory domain-containing protein, partial [Psychrosphaera sp.]|nr:carboxypeptidase-like regulatory domain-containing protein [Psychrosphaera sp.]
HHDADEDWLVFYVNTDSTDPKVYDIDVTDVGSDLDVIIEVYKEGVDTFFGQKNNSFNGGNENLSVILEEEGLFYIRILSDGNLTGDDTGYTVNLRDLSVGFLGAITGIITDESTGEGLPLVKIKSDTLGYSALSFPGGSYSLSHPAGNNVQVTYSANGYNSVSKVVAIPESGIVELDITLTPMVVDPAFNLDIDGNAKAEPFTAGMLIVRYLFGLRGDPLIAGVIASDATRTTAAEIEAFIQTGIDNNTLDIDGDGAVLPFTDGFLVIRYLFGSRGDILINQAISDTATRTTAAQIEAYLALYVE